MVAATIVPGRNARAAALCAIGLALPPLLGCGGATKPTLDRPDVMEITALNLRARDVADKGRGLYLFNPERSLQTAMEFPEKLRTFIREHPELRVTSVIPGEPETTKFEGYTTGLVSITFLVTTEPRIDGSKSEEDHVLVFGPDNYQQHLRIVMEDNPGLIIGPAAPTVPNFELSGGKSKVVLQKETGFVVIVRGKSEQLRLIGK